jgi:hypothetical protein
MVAISRRTQMTNSLAKIIGDTVVTVANITSNTVTLNWTAASSATGYIVGRSGTDSKGNGPWQTLDPVSTLSRVFIDLNPETQYTFYSEPQPGGVRKSLTVTTAAAAVAVPDRGPASFASLSAARTALNTPSDANYVMWNNSWPADRDLEDIFATELAANDILVLPERAQPYIIDSSEGFRAAGVQSVTGRNGQLPIVSSYKGIRSARTWFAMARARRGVLGLGPNAVIQMSTSSWTQEPQLQDKGSSMENGTYISPGRYWTNTNGVLQGELVGCQEKLLEAAHSSPYFGNFTVKARYLGGVAYHGVTIGGGSNAVVERLDMSGAWHGFLGIPNGESGGIAVNSNNNYLISKCILGTRDSTGFRTGTSPVMVNSSSGGRIEETDAGETFAGMMTLWNCSGSIRWLT